MSEMRGWLLMAIGEHNPRALMPQLDITARHWRLCGASSGAASKCLHAPKRNLIPIGGGRDP